MAPIALAFPTVPDVRYGGRPGDSAGAALPMLPWRRLTSKDDSFRLGIVSEFDWPAVPFTLDRAVGAEARISGNNPAALRTGDFFQNRDGGRPHSLASSDQPDRTAAERRRRARWSRRYGPPSAR